jgi:hypothetical protein
MASTDEIRLRLLITKLEAKLALNEIEHKDLAGNSGLHSSVTKLERGCERTS